MAAPDRDGQGSGPWARLRRARVPQLLGVYAGGSFAALQAADIFMTRLGVPDWAFFGLVLLLIAGVPLVLATALVQGGDRGGSRGALAVSGSGGLRRHFTWRNTAVWGAGSLALLVLLVGSFMGARALGIGPVGSLVAAGVLEREEIILLGDFQSPTGDDVLAGLVTEAFRIDFEQTPLLRVMSPGQVREGLLRMQRPPDASLAPSLARELAVREGVRAVLLGEVTTAGRGVIVSVRLVAPDSDESLVALRETAADSSAVIQAVDRLSSRLRERMGESLRTIRSGEPLELVSTASLPALRSYTQGVRAIDLERNHAEGIALLEDAIAADSAFAMAWRKLGVTLRNQEGNTERALEALTRAYELSDRLTERERLLARAAYHTAVTQDQDRAVAAYRGVLDLYPLDGTALNNLAVLLSDRGDLVGAGTLYQRALEANPDQVIYYTNLVQNHIRLEALDDAAQVAARFQARHPGLAEAQRLLFQLHVIRQEWDEAEAVLHAALEDPAMVPQDRLALLVAASNLDVVRGRLARARTRTEDAQAFALRSGLGVEGPVLEQFDTQVMLYLLDQGEEAGRILDRTLADMGGLPPEAAGEGAHLFLARFRLDLGDPAEARRLVAEWDQVTGGRPNQSFHELLREEVLLRIEVQEDEGALPGAIRRLQERTRDPQGLLSDHRALGFLLEQAGEDARAATEFERFLDRPDLWRLENDSWARGPLLEQVAALHEKVGNTERARARWRELAELWRDADPPLRGRGEAAAARALALSDREG
jgi:tetratricopeptide (TPR) repeat protein